MINLFKVATHKDAWRNVKNTLASGMIGEGPQVIEFKKQLEDKFRCKNLIPLNSGTSALTLALRLAGVEGGEVITTPFTMIATNVAIKAAGATPVFADIKDTNVNIDPADVARKINKRTKAIMAVHVGGIPCDMEELNKFRIPVISDAAHAILTEYRGKHISDWADYTMFSFQSIKQLNTGDGGALVVKDDKQYERGNNLKWFGMSREVPAGMTRLEHQMTADVKEWGYKYHMNDIAASIGLANLKLLDIINSRQRTNADYFQNKLRGIIKLPEIPLLSEPSWWGFYIYVDNRLEFIQKMKEAGIETTPMWRRNDEYTVFRQQFDDHFYSRPILPNMDKYQNKIVFIPVGWWLEQKDLDYIYESIVRIITS